MSTQPEYRAVKSDKPAGFFEDDLPYQAQWYTGTTANADGYERGGFYATEDEALEGAKRGKATEAFFQVFVSGLTDE